MVEPNVWGPPFWRTIHYVALGYPDKPTEADVLSYKMFFVSLGAVIPCQTCATNYARHLRDLPVEGFLTGNSGRLFEWTVHMHNMVNEETGKPHMEVSRALHLFSSGKQATVGHCNTPTAPLVNIPAMLSVFTILAGIGALLMYLYMRKRVGKIRYYSNS